MASSIAWTCAIAAKPAPKYRARRINPIPARRETIARDQSPPAAAGTDDLSVDLAYGLAKNLLRHHNDGIAEIAERVGYGSASAFSVAFTRCVGASPGVFARPQVTHDV